ncbi:MAG: ankyrin repeat domain-containing protein [Gammaproteobacteria bacterium]|nr:ankyrin repeat domain-containing protein [Gammaproteobacteria bacterium]
MKFTRFVYVVSIFAAMTAFNSAADLPPASPGERINACLWANLWGASKASVTLTGGEEPSISTFVSYILEDVNERCVGGGTPLLQIINKGSDDSVLPLVRHLFIAGADANIALSSDSLRAIFEPRTAGATALHIAASAGAVNRQSIIDLLIRSGGDVHARTGAGATPLHIAAAESNSDVVRLFLRQGSDANSHDDAGQTPLHYAARENSNPLVAMFLLSGGSEVNARDDRGWTPLHYAASESASEQVLRVLLAMEPDTEATTNTGQTAYDLIARNPTLKESEVLDMLMTRQ